MCTADVTIDPSLAISPCGFTNCFSKLFPPRFSINLVFFGLVLNVGGFGMDIYITQALFGICEIPAFLTSYMLTRRLGVRKSLLGFLGLGGLACLLILVIPAGTVQLFYYDHNMQLKVALTDMLDRNGGCCSVHYQKKKEMTKMYSNMSSTHSLYFLMRYFFMR